MSSSIGQSESSQTGQESDPLTGRRKYRAFLFSLTALTLLAATGHLDHLFVDGMAWLLGLFGLSNGVEHVAKAVEATRQT